MTTGGINKNVKSKKKILQTVSGNSFFPLTHPRDFLDNFGNYEVIDTVST